MHRKTIAHTLAITLGLLIGTAIASDDRPDHFRGEPAETLEQAISNLSEYNQRLEAVLAQELTPERLLEIHELTYTLENALGRIEQELEDIAETLEDVHVASELLDADAAKRHGDAYLSRIRILIP